ncbi:hypothetical protein DFS34DRAFT_444564 [Phlyctochytrium arcticum]|nr:hypothetical protein DFS34DRAFT_444564 [Phlyctochytrium arcticum]
MRPCPTNGMDARTDLQGPNASKADSIVMPTANKGTFGNWVQRKVTAVFRRSDRQATFPRVIRHIPPFIDEEPIPIDISGHPSDSAKSISRTPSETGSSMVDTMTAEQFAQAVGIEILVANDSEEDDNLTVTSSQSSPAIQDLALSHLPSSLALERNALTMPTAGAHDFILSISTTGSGKMRGPPPLDMGMFLPPTGSANVPSPSTPDQAIRPSIVRHVRANSMTLRPTARPYTRSSPSPIQDASSDLGCGSTYTFPRSISPSLPSDNSGTLGRPRAMTTTGPRLVQVTNRGRFTLTREESDHYTARRRLSVPAKYHSPPHTNSPLNTKTSADAFMERSASMNALPANRRRIQHSRSVSADLSSLPSTTRFQLVRETPISLNTKSSSQPTQPPPDVSIHQDGTASLPRLSISSPSQFASARRRHSQATPSLINTHCPKPRVARHASFSAKCSSPITEESYDLPLPNQDKPVPAHIKQKSMTQSIDSGVGLCDI